MATGVITTIGVVFQAASAIHGTLAVMYVGRFVAGLGVGAASTLTPLYVSECAPRAIRGGLTGLCFAFLRIQPCTLTCTSFLPAVHHLRHHVFFLVSLVSSEDGDGSY